MITYTELIKNQNEYFKYYQNNIPILSFDFSYKVCHSVDLNKVTESFNIFLNWFYKHKLFKIYT